MNSGLTQWLNFRYLYQHRYNFTLPDLIDRIDSPLVRESMEEWTFGDLSRWPTPQEYLHMIGTVTPKITQLWVDYFDNLGFDIILAPTSAITSRPIDAAEPYSEISGRVEVGCRLEPPPHGMLLHEVAD